MEKKMDDSFYELCDTREELAATKVALETLIEAAEVGESIALAAALSFAKNQSERVEMFLNEGAA